MGTCSTGNCNWITDSIHPDHHICTNCQRECWINGKPEPPQTKGISEAQATFFFAFVMLMVLALLSGQPQRSLPIQEAQSEDRHEAIAPIQNIQRSPM